MLTKIIVALTALAALAEQALALNSHHHLHRRHHLQKREQEVKWVTVWTTVTVDAPQATEAPPQENEVSPHRFLADSRPAQEPADAGAAPPTPANDVNAAVKALESVVPPPQTTLAMVAKPPVQVEVVSPSAGYGDQPPAPAPEPISPAPKDGFGSGGAPFSGKRGVAYNDADLANTLSEQCDKCGWAYNWGSSPQGLDPKFHFVPTLWGDEPRFTQQWDSDAKAALANGAKALLSFNEPDHPDQANMTPQQAAVAHAKYFNPYGGKALIGSPSVTNSGSPNQGIGWLESFMSECDKQQDKCRIDFCVVHWYSPEEKKDTLYEHLEKAHKACGGKPVWLTEFAPVNEAGKPIESPSFLRDVIPKLEEMSFVQAYAPFMCADGKLMSANQLSDTGKAFIS